MFRYHLERNLAIAILTDESMEDSHITSLEAHCK